MSDKIPDRTNPDYWEKALPGENALWFERFRTFLELGNDRTYMKVYLKHWRPSSQKLHPDSEERPNGPSRHLPGSWFKYVGRFKWQDRVIAYREWLVQEDKKLLGLYREELMQKERKISSMAFETTENLLKLPILEQRIEEEGRVIVNRPTNAGFLTAATGLAKTASELGRKGSNMVDIDKVEAIKALVASGNLDEATIDEVVEAYSEFEEKLSTVISKNRRKDVKIGFEPSNEPCDEADESDSDEFDDE